MPRTFSYQLFLCAFSCVIVLTLNVGSNLKITRICFSNSNFDAWFSSAHKHKDIRTRRMAYLTQFSMPALLNPMINKMADKGSAIFLLIWSHEVWVKVTYDWCAYACAYVDPVFTCQSYDIKHKHEKDELVRFSCAYAYIYPVFTCFHMCLCLCASENQASR